MEDMTFFNPETLAKPLGPLSHIARAKAAELVFIAGQVAVDGAGNLVGAGDFDAQCVQVFANIAAALDAVDAGWGNVAQFTTYLVRASDVAGFTSWREAPSPICLLSRKMPCPIVLAHCGKWNRILTARVKRW